MKKFYITIILSVIGIYMAYNKNYNLGYKGIVCGFLIWDLKLKKNF